MPGPPLPCSRPSPPRRASARARAFNGALAALALPLLACGSSETINPVGDWNRPVIPPSDDDAEAQRAGCAYQAGSLPAETQGRSQPDGATIPIDHIVVIIQENRSFDHYFQKLPEYGQPDVEVAPPDFTNPDVTGKLFAPVHETRACIAGTSHTWADLHEQVGDGSMDGFIVSNEGKSDPPIAGVPLDGQRAMGYYDSADLPFYYWLASEFALTDGYHSSLLGPTWPNRMFFYAGSSYGRTQNVSFVPDHTLFEYLGRRGVDYRVYFSDRDGLGAFLLALIPDPDKHVRTIDDYFHDMASGDLPSVALVNSTFHAKLTEATWEHPPDVPQMGERFVAHVIDALVKSSGWSSSALFLTYDEHGGLFDHVTPPPACPPDDHEPELLPDDPPGRFDQYGVRVPMIAVSPWAKRHFVSHHVYDHTSIARFIEARFTLGALSARDANARVPWEMFDFASPPRTDVAPITIPSVDPAVVAACAEMFEKK